jgi:hypothetical protein
MTGRRVLKFTVAPTVTVIATADEPRFLAVGWQGDQLCVWAEATVGDGWRTPMVAVATGDPVPGPDRVYVGTASTDHFGSPIVMHVYHGPRQP